MKKLAVFIIALALPACSLTLPSDLLQEASNACQPNGGINSLLVKADEQKVIAICTNSAEFSYYIGNGKK